VGYAPGSLPGQMVPAFATRPEDAATLAWNECCGTNLAVYLPEALRRKDGGKVGLVVKSCDAKAVVGLLRESQLAREDVVLLGVPCTGLWHEGRLAPKCYACAEEVSPPRVARNSTVEFGRWLEMTQRLQKRISGGRPYSASRAPHFRSKRVRSTGADRGKRGRARRSDIARVLRHALDQVMLLAVPGDWRTVGVVMPHREAVLGEQSAVVVDEQPPAHRQRAGGRYRVHVHVADEAEDAAGLAEHDEARAGAERRKVGAHLAVRQHGEHAIEQGDVIAIRRSLEEFEWVACDEFHVGGAHVGVLGREVIREVEHVPGDIRNGRA